MLFVIVGGCGFVGFRLALRLSEEFPEAKIRCLDVRKPETHRHPKELVERFSDRISIILCDIQDVSSLLSALSGARCVFHLASYGMSGSSMMEKDKIRSINVEGTNRLIECCVESGVSRFVYVSSYNAIFGGQPILGGTEDSLDYFPIDHYTEEYSRTKQIAEIAVRRANGSSLKVPDSSGGHFLATCAVRPAAIYGDGEERHFPRILEAVQSGLAFFSIGSRDILCDWIFVDNFVFGLLKAWRRLEEPGKAKIPTGLGEVFFLSDDQPVNNFAFLAQFLYGLGYSGFFLFAVPTAAMRALARLCEVAHQAISPIVKFSPFLTRAEVDKVGVTHFMDVSRARQVLSFEPPVRPEVAVRRCVSWYKQNGFAYQPRKHGGLAMRVWIMFLLFFTIFFIFWFGQ